MSYYLFNDKGKAVAHINCPGPASWRTTTLCPFCGDRTRQVVFFGDWYGPYYKCTHCSGSYDMDSLHPPGKYMHQRLDGIARAKEDYRNARRGGMAAYWEYDRAEDKAYKEFMSKQKGSD